MFWLLAPALAACGGEAETTSVLTQIKTVSPTANVTPQDHRTGTSQAQDGAMPKTAAERAAHEPLHPDWTSYTNANYVTDLLVDGDAVWAATAGGVVRWDVGTGEYIKLTTEHGLAGNDVRAIAVGPDGSLWFGTPDGVSRLTPDGRWQTYTEEDGLAGNDVRAIAVGPDGSLWFGTPDGVSRLTPDGRWQTYTTDDGLASNWVLAIAVGPDGSLWFGTWGGGVSRYRPLN
ncbi:MAG: hypothetical protein KatS3mg109_1990 [Pirellulaceae bacterium]|nr:MAG: hypothetical protein KatS3mg109_1990 [Pirellulaceae bacterium]